MTQPTPTPQEKARSLARAIARNDDSLRTIEITKAPSKAQPIPDDPSPFDDDEDFEE